MMCSGFAVSSASSPSKPEMNEIFISWAASYRGGANQLGTPLLNGWFGYHSRASQAPLAVEAPVADNFASGKGEIFLRQLCDE